MDGDGSIHITKSRTQLRPVISIGLYLTVEGLQATSEFHSLYGGSKGTYFRHALNNPNQRPVCKWSLSGHAVFSALDDLDDALVLKKKQSRLLLSNRHLFPGRIGPSITDTVLHKRHDLLLQLRSVRAEAQTTTIDDYSTQLLFDSRGNEQQRAYTAGFCDADAYFGCVPSGSKFAYAVKIVQKNHAFLQAFKDTILGGRGSNVFMRRDGISCLDLNKASDVQYICALIRPFSIIEAKQLDVIMSEPPSATAREALASMHGNQGKKIKNMSEHLQK